MYNAGISLRRKARAGCLAIFHVDEVDNAARPGGTMARKHGVSPCSVNRQTYCRACGLMSRHRVLPGIQAFRKFCMSRYFCHECQHCDTLIACSRRSPCQAEPSLEKPYNHLGDLFVSNRVYKRLHECSKPLTQISTAMLSSTPVEMQRIRFYSTGILPYHTEQREGTYGRISACVDCMPIADTSAA